jgi:2-alkenal reductase
MTACDEISREVKLKRRPTGLPQASDFEIAEVQRPRPKDGEVLVRNQYCRVPASLRMMISEGAEAVEGVPIPALLPGDTLAEETIGEVVEAPGGSGWLPGDVVQHPLGWREYAAVPTSMCRRIRSRLPELTAHLSHGWTAYAALTRPVQIQPGDTVFITSGAGAVGSMAGQIARLLGARRVVGSTSSAAKAERLVRELGYDAAVIRGDRSIQAQLAEAAPEGIDVVLDNVGGEQLQAAVSLARDNARLVVLGALSGQLAATGAGRTAPVVLDSFQILLKKITIRGYSADDDPDARAEWEDRFAAWLRSGMLRFPCVVLHGIGQAPQAIQRIAEGQYFGTVIIEL